MPTKEKEKGPAKDAPKDAPAPAPLRGLSQAQKDHFFAKGYVLLNGCFKKEAAQEWIDAAYKRMKCDPKSPKTWKEKRLFLKSTASVEVGKFAPDAWGAICDLLGGKDRIERAETQGWPDAFVVTFPSKEQPWLTPSAQVPGWHSDGSFKHFLDSPELGVLVLVLWSDIEPQGGGPFVACDSVKVVAELLRQHPEGVDQQALSNSVSRCRDFAEITGKAGDVLIMHPYMLHAESVNHSSRPVFTTITTVGLTAPMSFNRAGAAGYSLVEQSVLKALKAERVDFKIKGARSPAPKMTPTSTPPPAAAPAPTDKAPMDKAPTDKAPTDKAAAKAGKAGGKPAESGDKPAQG